MVLQRPVLVDASQKVGNDTNFELPDSLVQAYVVVPQKLRLAALSAFLHWKSKSCARGDLKVVVFVNTCDEVIFLQRLFARAFWPPRSSHFQDADNSDSDAGEDREHDALVDLALFTLHGNMEQADRSSAYKAFCSARGGLLIATDVAARGLHLPAIDWIVQHSPPADIADYVHRVGRTARLGRRGRALLLLADNEQGFLKALADRGVNMQSMSLTDLMATMTEQTQTTASLPTHISSLVAADGSIREAAERAFTSYTRSYAAYPKAMKAIFHVRKLHLGHVASSFGLKATPSAIAGSDTARPTKANVTERRKHKIGRRRVDDREREPQAKKQKGRPHAVKCSISEFASG